MPKARPSVTNRSCSRQQRLEAPRWEGKTLRVAVGRASETDERMTVTFSVLNSSPRTIELLSPQIQLAGTSKARHGKAIKSESVAIKDYQMTARRLAPGARADGVVMFERPAFKKSTKRCFCKLRKRKKWTALFWHRLLSWPRQREKRNDSTKWSQRQRRSAIQEAGVGETAFGTSALGDTLGRGRNWRQEQDSAPDSTSNRTGS